MKLCAVLLCLASPTAGFNSRSPRVRGPAGSLEANAGLGGRTDDLQGALRRLLASVAALQVVAGSDGANAASFPASLADTILPPTVSKLILSTTDVLVPLSRQDAGGGSGSGPVFTFPSDPSNLNSWQNEFSIKLPEARMGFSTVPSDSEARNWGGFGVDVLKSFKLPELEVPVSVAGITDGRLTSVDGVRSLFQDGLAMLFNDWVPTASILGLILISNAIQYSEKVEELLEVEIKEKEEWMAKFDAASKESKDAALLRSDALALAAEIEILKGSLQAAQLKEKYAQAGSAASAEAASSSAQMVESLQAEIEGLRAAAKNSGMADKVAFLQARERKLVDAVKFFMLETGYMSPAVAQMLMSASAADIIHDTAKRKGLSRREKELESEVAALKTQVASLSKSGGNSADADKYIKVLTAEVDDLKQKLLSSDERFMDLQRSMQSKVDSAKAVAKELNARLETKGATASSCTPSHYLIRSSLNFPPPLPILFTLGTVKSTTTPASATVKASTKSTPPAPRSPAPTIVAPASSATGSSVVAARLRILRAMSASQRKRLTKADLEGELKKMGMGKKAEDGRLYAEMLKQELLDIVEGIIA